ncbi:hypothetical protein ABMA28_003879 [Loxostege sticticalis]|uniref:Uncharacterized protein n=1 Tax=Loxostege sticticalis TaxID=481309 RepID=A0ABD0STD3_LOXSC
MPEESKKNQHKGRDAKEQRKPRQGRHQGGSHDKKHEKKAEEPKVSVPQKPVYEEPGPEFYKNLKRETDEILKITEEANSKYKKKEIQSNWAKYEMPIESYDEIEEQENMGADYEKLIDAPLSVGGHFQFKHEKSWDTDTGPSPYDKYFEINMDNLFLSISTVPFHERINIDKSIFSETDMLTMNNRATRFKQKYFKDKTFTTPELQIQDKILSSLSENVGKVYEAKEEEDIENNEILVEQKEDAVSNETLTKQIKDLEINDLKAETTLEQQKVFDNTRTEIGSETLKVKVPPIKELQISKDLDNFNDLILEEQIKKPQDLVKESTEIADLKEMQQAAIVKQQPKEDPQKAPIIESPEELEKWLDDFLDS